MDALMQREEMEYTLPTNGEHEADERQRLNSRRDDGEGELNRFCGDWVTLHLFATLYQLSEYRPSTFHFLKNGGIALAQRVRHLSVETLATAARLTHGQGGIQGLLQNKQVPQLVRDAQNTMQMATADVLGTDGHRRLCRHEGHAYMALFGPPLVFCTPNLADGKQPLLLIVQGQEISLDDSLGSENMVLPKYRDMLRRLARDPVG